MRHPELRLHFRVIGDVEERLHAAMLDNFCNAASGQDFVKRIRKRPRLGIRPECQRLVAFLLCHDAVERSAALRIQKANGGRAFMPEARPRSSPSARLRPTASSRPVA
jgi:hypothetical protein